MKKIEGIPSNPIFAIFIFGWLFLYLFYIHNVKGTQLNIFEFYTLTLIPILLVVSIRGEQLFKVLGFTLNNAPTRVIIIRFFLSLAFGVAIGYLVYKLGQLSFISFGYHILPFDVFVLQLFFSPVFLQNLLNSFIIAFHEEILRIVALLIFYNYFVEKRNKNALLLAILFSSLLFVLVHYFSWGGLNIPIVIVMTTVVSLFTISGYALNIGIREIEYKQFSIWVPLFAHLTYDLSIFLSLSLYGSPFSISVVPIRI